MGSGSPLRQALAGLPFIVSGHQARQGAQAAIYSRSTHRAQRRIPLMINLLAHDHPMDESWVPPDHLTL